MSIRSTISTLAFLTLQTPSSLARGLLHQFTGLVSEGRLGRAVVTGDLDVSAPGWNNASGYAMVRRGRGRRPGRVR